MRFSARCIFLSADLSGCESIRDQEVEVLVRATAGQKETDTARIFQDYGTDLEQV